MDIQAAVFSYLVFSRHISQPKFLAVFIIAGIGSPVLERSTFPYTRGLRPIRAASYDLDGKSVSSDVAILH
jgi:hypothetical protein